MKPVLSTEEVVRLEDIIEREGTSKAELMELAGEFAANEVLKLNPDRVLVLVGFGNNLKQLGRALFGFPPIS